MGALTTFSREGPQIIFLQTYIFKMYNTFLILKILQNVIINICYISFCFQFQLFKMSTLPLSSCKRLWARFSIKASMIICFMSEESVKNMQKMALTPTEGSNDDRGIYEKDECAKFMLYKYTYRHSSTRVYYVHQHHLSWNWDSSYGINCSLNATVRTKHILKYHARKQGTPMEVERVKQNTENHKNPWFHFRPKAGINCSNIEFGSYYSPAPSKCGSVAAAAFDSFCVYTNKNRGYVKQNTLIRKTT
jgi:hypothetical protein